MIFYKNFFYIKYHNGKDFLFWRCQNRKCTAKLSTSPNPQIENLVLIGSHNHILSENDISKVFLDNKIKDLAANTAFSTSKVYSAATTTTKLCELPIIKKKLKKYLNNRIRTSDNPSLIFALKIAPQTLNTVSVYNG